jgi:hypothetical protein
MNRHRPTLLDHLALLAAKAHCRSAFNRFLSATKRATAVQEQALLTKIRRNADSQFGYDHRFSRVRSAKDFVRQVPIRTYEDHQPYIDRVKVGDFRALFGPNQRVLMFALSSGTTDKPKYIPVTEPFLKEYRQGWNACGIKALLDHPHAFLRPILQTVSRIDETRTAAGIPCGAISGLMAANQKRLVRKYYTTPAVAGDISDATAKYYTIMRLAVPKDVSWMVTASPATQLRLAQVADEHREQLIRDVHDGTLWAELPIGADIRNALRSRLGANCEAGKRLERIVSEHGALLPKHYWDLGFVANWTGGTIGLYLQDFPESFGNTPIRDIGLLASEGRVSIPVDDGTPAGILDITSHFFEFIPRDGIEESSPPALRSHEVEVGQEYFVLMTTSSGLYRYHLGDLVRVVDFVNEAPVIEFLNKGEHVSSISGEKLTEHQVVQAMDQAADVAGTRVMNFVLAPQWSRPPRYVLHVESVDPTRCQRLATDFERQLAALNVEYASKRSSERLGAVQVNVLPKGFLARLDVRLAARHRQGNEQYKHQYLYTRPGDDADFPEAMGYKAPASSSDWRR